MSSTIESIHTKILEKINGAVGILKMCENLATKSDSILAVVKNNRLNMMQMEFEEIESKYKLNIIPILTRYYDSTDKSYSEQNLTRDYYRITTSENYDSQIRELYLRIDAMLLAMSLHIENNQRAFTQITRDFNKLKTIDLTPELIKTNYERCQQCGDQMNINAGMSHLRCVACGCIFTLFGTVFADNQFFNQDGQKSKHCSYNPNRHFRFWINRILARETKTFPQDEIDEIKRIVTRDGLFNINCRQMRKVLQEAKLTSYNNHCSLLIKLVTGVSPPQPTFNELRRISIKFNKIMDLYEKIKSLEDNNRPYYPYWIYKIVEWEFRNNREKLKILDYIYLQSDDTIARRDLVYEQICKMAEPADDLHFETTIVEE